MENNNSRSADSPLSDRALRAHLERVTGRQIRSREDISLYVNELSARGQEQRAKSHRIKSALLATLLTIAAAQYYYIDVQLQILSQPALTVFVPMKGAQGPYLGG
jgi:hypothetical protein